MRAFRYAILCAGFLPALACSSSHPQSGFDGGFGADAGPGPDGSSPPDGGRSDAGRSDAGRTDGGRYDSGAGEPCGSGRCAPGERCCRSCDDAAGFCVGLDEPCPAAPCPPPGWSSCNEAMEGGAQSGDPCVGDWGCDFDGDCCSYGIICHEGRIDRWGECDPGCHPQCRSSAECAPEAFCDFGPACGGEGTCTRLPLGCTDDCPGVCGCNGQSFCNDCEAHAAGVSVAHERACEMPPPSRACGGWLGDTCSSDEFCDFAGDYCDWADASGTCRPRPGGACPELYAPVCGCDGQTYDNECFAQASGVDAAHEGSCDGEPPPEPDCRSTGCPDGDYCALCWGAWACVPEGAVC